MSKYTANLVPHIFKVSSETVADGNYDFDVGDLYDPLPFFLDGFYFVDGAGAPVGATAGTVKVQVSSDNVLWRDVVDGEFPAATLPSEITPPNGTAPIEKLRITLTGVTGAAGFKAIFVRG